MKKIIILLLLVTSFTFSKANTDSIPLFEFDAVDKILAQSYEPVVAVNNATKTKANPVLKALWQGITLPWRPVWGIYTEPGDRSKGPYTVFHRYKGTTIASQLVPIRQKILAKDPVYFTLYAEIYKNTLYSI